MPDNRDRNTKGQFREGNKASMSSGLTNGLLQSRLPKGCGKMQRDLCKYRRHLRDAAKAVHGAAMTALHDGLVATAVAHERRRRLAERWQAKCWEEERLTTEEYCRLDAIIGTASEARDRAAANLLTKGNDRSAFLAFLTAQQQHDEQRLPPPPREQDLADIETGEELARK